MPAPSLPAAAASSPARAAPAKERAPATITLLYTTDEHGWLLPTIEGPANAESRPTSTDKGEVRGGAAEMLAQWIAEEGHCPGNAIAGGPAMPAPPACSDPATLALSGGDNWTGPAISSYFRGVPMADAMARMGYAASAFGNHEFDFGREAFVRNREHGRFPFLAANLRVTGATESGAELPALDHRGSGLRVRGSLDLPAFAVFERRSVRIGVIGLATQETLKTAMASRFVGIAFENEEEALARAVPEAWRAAPDALVLIAHECPEKLEPLLERHPDWGLSFVGGGHCHKKADKRVGGVPLINPSWRLRSYARVRLEIDPRRPLRERVVSTTAEVIDVRHAEGAAPAPPDASIATASAAWQAKLDQALGDPIGYSEGIENSAEIGRWIGEAWRRELGVDVALLNKGGIRQAVPRGTVTSATVYSILPFDNKLLVCSLTGREVLENAANVESVVAGLTRRSDGRYVLSNGKPVEGDKRYSVATIDFLYFGGDGFQLEKQDPSPKWTGLDWRAPVIAWTKARATTKAAPLEQLLR